VIRVVHAELENLVASPLFGINTQMRPRRPLSALMVSPYAYLSYQVLIYESGLTLMGDVIDRCNDLTKKKAWIK